MRLVCPNCEAKYEVPEDAIPDVGRDVQCASCGHSWFQMRPRPAAAGSEVPLYLAPEPEPADAAAPEAATVAEVEPEAPAEQIIDAEAIAAEPPATELAEAETLIAEDEADQPLVEGAVYATAAASADPEPDSQVDPSVDADNTVAEPFPVAEGVVEAMPETAKLSAAEAEAAEIVFAGDADTDFEPAPELAAPVQGTSEIEPEAEPAPEGRPEADPAPAPVAAAAYAVDESVLAILREEAEREAQARRSEASPLESQTDLGLDAAMPGREKPAPSKLNGDLVDHASDAALKPSARRDLLPDVEEINSTLRPSEIPVADFIQPGPPQRETRGFRSGFLMVMTIAIIGTAIYTAAPRLSVMVPALAGPLDAFVGAVDSLRLSLDGVMQSATVAINGS